ncbi:MAG: ATP-binding domain-containing protein [Candidatus Lokiarchaeota archaeon]|nr:ATP-binding domain-containing protein [Candidatus Lokiarchaeota archaeon]
MNRYVNLFFGNSPGARICSQSLTLCLYSNTISINIFASLGIKASGRTKKLPNSYRNSKRVGEFAQFIMPKKLKELSKSQDEFRFPEKYIGMHGSINYVIAKSKIEEYDEILKIIQEELKNSTKGKSFLVLFQRNPWNDRNNKFFSQAMKYDLFENFLDTCTSSGYGIVVTSLRKAKGLEADIVFIPDLEQYYYQDRQLLYVGMTRTKNKLILSSTEPSQPKSLVEEIQKYPDWQEE